MAKKAAGVPVWISVDSSQGAPIYRQLYERMRTEILGGMLPARTRLPSTRTLAAELGVSRSTVVTAFEHLLAEGYLEGKVGSGTFVAGSLPEELLGVRARKTNEPGPARSGRGLSRRGTLLAATHTTAVRDMGTPRAFRPGVPALDEFPHAACAGSQSLCNRLQVLGFRHQGKEVRGNHSSKTLLSTGFPWGTPTTTQRG